MTKWEDILARLEGWKHWNGLRNSEQATIQGLVLPVLRLVGFEVDNPEIVYPQEQVNNGRPDFVIYKSSKKDGGKPRLIVEAKKLGHKKLGRSDIGQIIGYVREQEDPDVKWYLLTNGLQWILFNKDHLAPLFNIELTHPCSDQVLTKLLAPENSEPDIAGAMKILINTELESIIKSDGEGWQQMRKDWIKFEKLAKPVEMGIKRLRQQYKGEGEYLVELRNRLIEALKTQAPEPPAPWLGVKMAGKASFTSRSEALKQYVEECKVKDAPRLAKALAKFLKNKQTGGSVKHLPMLEGKYLCVNGAKGTVEEALELIGQAFTELQGTSFTFYDKTSGNNQTFSFK